MLIELFPAWLVYAAFMVGIVTMIGVAALAFYAAWRLRGEDKKREAEEALRYAQEMGPYPWGLYQSDD
jgi:heme/copper-type cytochrome/quinol oxidase subunit 2